MASMTIDPVDAASTVRAAEAAHAAAAAAFTACGARLMRYTSLLDPHVAQHPDRPSTEADILDAHEHIAAVRVEHARATRALRETQAALDEARSAERRRQLTALLPMKRAAVARLGKALRIAADANAEVAAIEAREREIAPAAAFQDVIAWVSLLPDTPEMQSHLTHWLGCVRAQGYESS